MVGCSERNASQNDSVSAPITPRIAEREPPRPIVRRTAAEVADLIKGTCLKATSESASARRFEAILSERGLNPTPKPDRGRLKVWQISGAEVGYSYEPKGSAEGVLCQMQFDPRGIPKAKRVAPAIKPLLNMGDPSNYRTVLPSGPIGYRWKFTAPDGEYDELTIGDLPELCVEEVGCTPPVLDVLHYHAKNADSR
jgi:hypothetical protein